MPTVNMRTLVILVAILLVAAAVRVWNIDEQSIWFDEGWSAFAGVQPSLAQAFAADPTNPPLYYVLLNVHVRLLGDSAFSLRLFSLLSGLLVIPLSYRLARRLFGVRAGLYAALLVAVSPPLWWASQEARMYTLLALLVLGCALAWHTLLRRPDRRAWLALLLCELALLYAHNTGPVIVLWLNTVTLLAWIVRRSLARPGWRLWVGGQVMVGLLWLPWFALRFVELQEANSAVVSAPVIGLPLLAQVWQSFWVSPWALVDREPVLTGLSLVLLVGLAFVPWRLSGARWLAAHIVLLVAFLLLGLGVLGNELHGRYLVMIVPLLLTLFGAGLAHVALTGPRMFAASIAVVLLAANISLARNPVYQHDDARGMVQHYGDSLTSEDTVLAWSYADRYDLWYYWERLGVTARRVTLPEGADLDAIAPLLPDAGDVAVNVWYTQRADYRGMLGCLLGAGSVREPDAYTVYGMSSLTYHAPELQLPTGRPFAALVMGDGISIARVATVSSIPARTADYSVCMSVTLEMLADVDADLKAVVSVRNSLGWEIARTDAVFATANQRTSSQLQPGESLSAYALLRLPYGAPPGDYDVRLHIYDEQAAPSGYDLSVDGTMLSRTIPVAQWHVIPGADWNQTGRTADMPQSAVFSLGDDLQLMAHDVPSDSPPVANGQTIASTLLWQGTAPLPDLELTGEDWQVIIPPLPGPRDTITRDWRQARIPVEAASGLAELRLPDGSVIGRYRIEHVPGVFEAPPYDSPADGALPGVGALIGFTLAGDTVDRSAPLPVTLVWRADGPADVAYTVFVQLIDADGTLIAQSDSAPAGGARPTTDWRAGEYIEDHHQLEFNARATPGPATLIAGMYDPLTGTRVTAADGLSYIALPAVVTVR